MKTVHIVLSVALLIFLMLDESYRDVFSPRVNASKLSIRKPSSPLTNFTTVSHQDLQKRRDETLYRMRALLRQDYVTLNFSYYLGSGSSKEGTNSCTNSKNPCNSLLLISQSLNETLYSNYSSILFNQQVIKKVVLEIELLSNILLDCTERDILKTIPNLEITWHFLSSTRQFKLACKKGSSVISMVQSIWNNLPSLFLINLELENIAIAGLNVTIQNCLLTSLQYNPLFTAKGDSRLTISESIMDQVTLHFENSANIEMKNINVNGSVAVYLSYIPSTLFENITCTTNSKFILQLRFGGELTITNSIFYNSSFSLVYTDVVSLSTVQFLQNKLTTTAISAVLGDNIVLTNVSSINGTSFLKVSGFKAVSINSSLVSDNGVSIVNSDGLQSIINIESAGYVSITYSTFTRNRGNRGGSINMKDIMNLNVFKNEFVESSAEFSGGALFIDPNPISMFLKENEYVIEQNLFKNNSANTFGGAVFVKNIEILADHLNEYVGNTAKLAGGAMYFENVLQFLKLMDSRFEGNRVKQHSYGSSSFFDGTGGAVSVEKCAEGVFITGCSFNHNKAPKGGALFLGLVYDFSGMYATNFTYNQAYITGGAWFSFYSNLENIFDVESFYSNNEARLYGNNFLSSVQSLLIPKNFRFISAIPGQEFEIPATAVLSNGERVPTNVENYTMTTSNPSILISCTSTNTSIKIVFYLYSANDIIDEDLYDVEFNSESLFSLQLINCNEDEQLGYDDTLKGYVCIEKVVFPLALVLGLSVPALVVIFSIGIIVGVLIVKQMKNVSRKIKKLESKEQAEIEVERKIIAKTIGDFQKPFLQNDFLEMESKISTHFIPIEDIEIVTRIAEGGNGIVYLANWRSTQVAVKSIKTSSDLDGDEFEREVALLSNLRHPNILFLFGYSMTDRSKYMITEYIERGSLDKILYSCKTGKEVLSFGSKLSILIGVAEGMDYLHSLNPAIIHRDLKPGNILINSFGVAKVCDFGISKSVASNNSNTMTRNLGTMLYLAPEMLLTNNSQKSDCNDKILRATKVDIYSFAIIMHELFFESTPFTKTEKTATFENGLILEENSPFQILTNVIKGERPNIPFNDTQTVLSWMKKFFYNHSEMPEMAECVLEYAALMRMCWHPDALARPSFSVIGKKLRDLLNKVKNIR